MTTEPQRRLCSAMQSALRDPASVRTHRLEQVMDSYPGFTSGQELKELAQSPGPSFIWWQWKRDSAQNGP